jgi:hypothetical protein
MCNLSPDFSLYAGRGCNNYHFEDDLCDTHGIAFLPIRKKISKGSFPPGTRYL